MHALPATAARAAALPLPLTLRLPLRILPLLVLPLLLSVHLLVAHAPRTLLRVACVALCLALPPLPARVLPRLPLSVRLVVPDCVPVCISLCPGAGARGALGPLLGPRLALGGDGRVVLGGRM